ncbi:MAG: DinB family protein, partial [Bacteroidota bacterium]
YIKKRLERMDNHLRLLFKELESYSESKLNETPQPDKWSVFQVLHHLIRVERGSLQYVNKKLSHQPELKKAGIQTAMRTAALSVFAGVPIKIKAPTAVGSNLPPHSTFWEIVKLYKESRHELHTFFADVPAELLNKEVYKHPLVGRMTLVGMLSFFEAHFFRHRKQIYKTLKKVKAIKQV